MIWRDTLRFRSPLARRLIVWIVLFSSTITLALTLIQLFRDYRLDVATIEENLHQIESVHLPTIAESLWATDQSRLQLQLEGIVRLRDMHFVELREGDFVWASAGSRETANEIRRETIVRYTVDGREQILGTLTAVATLDGVYARLFDKAFTILLSNAVKTFLVALFILLLFHWLVTRHLQRIGNWLSRQDADNPPPLALDKIVRAPVGDEIDVLVDTLNRFRAVQAKTLAAVTNEHQRYQGLFDYANDIIFIADPDSMRILDANRRACEHTGYTRDELLRMTIIQLGPPEDKSALEAAIRHLNRAGHAVFERHFRRKDGAPLPVEVSARVIRFGETRVIEVFARDLTERQRAEAAIRVSEDRYKDLVESSLDLICTHDLNGRLLSVNQRSTEIIGFRAEELIGRNMRELLAPQHQHEFDEYLARIKRDGRASGFMQVLTQAGERRVWSYRNTLRTEGVTAPVVRGTAHDVTNEIETTHKLKASESRLHATFEQAAVGISHVAPDGRWLKVNQKLCDIVGFTRDELLSKTFQDITHPDDLDADLALVHKVLANEIQTYTMTKRYIRKDGRIVWINLTVSLVRKTNGAPDYFIAVVEDITERVRAENALLESEALYHELIELAADGIFVADADSRITQVNAAGCALSGYTRDELLRLTLVDLIPPEDRQLDPLRLDQLRDDMALVRERRLLCKDGTTVPVEVNVKRLPGRRIQGIVRDITELRAAEQESRRQQELLRAVVENNIDAMFIKNSEGRYLFINAACGEVIGCAPEKAIGSFDRDLFPPEAAEAMRRRDQEIMEGGKVETFEETVPTAQGPRTFLTTKIPLPGADNRYDRLIGVARDVTVQKRAEAALREREEILRLFVEHSPAAIAMLDTDMRYVAVSRRWLSDYGLGDRELIGRSHYEVFPEVPQRWKDIHRRCLAGATERMDEDPFVRADGRIDWVKWEIRPWSKIENGIGGIIIFSELVTAHKQAEAEREKLLDELTARNIEMENFVYTISHDLKSPLITIGGFSTLLKKDIAKSDSAAVADSLAEINKAVAQMQAHIGDLLLLSRTGRVISKQTDVALSALLDDVIGRFGPRIESDVAQLIVAPDLPTIRVDRKGFLRVYINLIDNALKYRRSEAAPHIEIGWRQESDELRLFVRDNGIGIKKEFQQRIFGLFQRADSKTEGAGVGLAISKRVIEVHGGRIWVESEPEKGSTFWIALPASVMVSATLESG